MLSLSIEAFALLLDLLRDRLDPLRAKACQHRIARGGLHLAAESFTAGRNTLPSKHRHIF